MLLIICIYMCCQVDISNKFELFNILDVDLGGGSLSELQYKQYRQYCTFTTKSISQHVRTTPSIQKFRFFPFCSQPWLCSVKGELSPHELLTGLLSLRGDVSKGNWTKIHRTAHFSSESGLKVQLTVHIYVYNHMWI